MKDYRYNFGFLAQWMHENHMSKKDILQALQTKDYGGLRDWIDGVRPMHIEAILRLCNTYNIPLGCFFFDKNARAELAPSRPSSNDQTEPNVHSDKKRGRGLRREAISMEAAFHQDTRIPGSISAEDMQVEKAPVTDDARYLQMQLDYERKISEIKDDYQEKMEKLRRDYDQKIDSRDAIIQSQQKEIDALRQDMRRRDVYGCNIVSSEAPFSEEKT